MKTDRLSFLQWTAIQDPTSHLWTFNKTDDMTVGMRFLLSPNTNFTAEKKQIYWDSFWVTPVKNDTAVK